jgi:crotonobetainyl-CoA:carnitine CoA-transferase CaiB-like acyl-CoA transferase
MEPLSHIRVIDLTRARSGPTCVRQLSEMGAQVIKVEMPGEEDDSVGGRHGSDFQNLHPNKRSIAVNMKTDEGREIIYRMARNADVLVENFRPRVKHRLKIDYDTLHAINPRLVYTSISGFGQTGPYSERPGLDQIAQGLSGFMTVNGFPEHGPLRAGLPIADLTGGIMAAYGTVVALLERERSGEGQWVDTSLLQGMMRLMDLQAARWLQGGEIPPQAGNYHPVGVPTGVFKCRDGSIIIQASGGRLYTRLLEVIGAPELATDPRFATAEARYNHREEMTEELEKRLTKQDMAYWQERLNETGVPAGPILNTRQAFENEQVQTMPAWKPAKSEKLGKLKLTGHGVNLSRTPPSIRSAAPERGQHTDEVMRELEYTPDEIAAMREHGSIA